MRGKLPSWFWVFLPFRITPADAGKTLRCIQHGFICRDHPRGCGENSARHCQQRVRKGSPPRMRGKLILIPCVQPRGMDHPRGCGENASCLSYTRNRKGITPADAGKTFIKWGLRHTIRDHPRGCGENSCACRVWDTDGGSPPRMRGKRCVRLPLCALRRITPADAGKTPVIIYAYISAWDHPRGCGENLGRGAKPNAPAGSPPRMRGKLKNLLDAFEGDGITPADAGKTLPIAWRYACS